ncbi:ABC transport system permease component YbhR [Salmonella enterica subsp. arizonae]|uniref:ABC transport system permease component YbhR n=1 Tax=Salmonella enterica subsp. arizonae TaxID=59203 RepID=A0A379TER8_SALER|nr:ABC transport system permease component YbhR [Salmonella enterica subsp. arizonae]
MLRRLKSQTRPSAIYNEDNGKHSVELTQRFARAKAFTHVLLLNSPQEIQPTIDTQKALLLVRFPANFSRNLDTFQSRADAAHS